MSEDTLLGRLARGEASDVLAGELGARIAALYRAGAVVPEQAGGEAAAAFEAALRADLDAAEACVVEAWSPAERSACVSRALLVELRASAERLLGQHGPALARRARAGSMHEGHGALDAERIRLDDLGPLFPEPAKGSEERRIDAAGDLARLTVDLRLHGHAPFAVDLARRCARELDDRELIDLLPLHELAHALRLGLAGHARARGLDDGDPEAERLRRRAMRCLQVAASTSILPGLILMCGLPASGKSYMAQHVAPLIGARLIRSDTLRKLLAGLPLQRQERLTYDTGLYSPEMKQRTYQAMLEGSDESLLGGWSVVNDATFSKEEYRRPFVELARRRGVPFLALEVTAAEDVIRERMERRANDPNEVSDADFPVYLRLKQNYEPLRELAPSQFLSLDTFTPLEDTTALILERFVEHRAR